MDILRKASKGITETKGGMNIPGIKKYLLSLPGADEKQIRNSKRSELNVSKVETPKVEYATQEDLKLNFDNTILPKELINIVLKYTETTIKVEFDDTIIEYSTQSQFNDFNCGNVVNIDIYGVLILTNPADKFYNKKIRNITGYVVLIGDASHMFNDAINFNSDISNWDVSQVINMESMFSEAESFNSDISGWDVSQVINMESMFSEATNFNSDISGWNTSKVTNMSGMFSETRNFNSDISGWNTSKVTNMRFMFDNATNFNSDISDWNTSKVTNMRYMFSNAISFNSDISGWNTSKVIYMDFMFCCAINFNQDLSSWDTSLVTDMSLMFYNALKFKGTTKKVNGFWKIIQISN